MSQPTRTDTTRTDQNMAEAEGEDEGSASLITEFWWFLRENKKWFLIPLIVLFLILALVVLIGHGAGPLSPFIYSLL